MPVIDVDECRRFVLYLRFYSRLQLHVKAPGLLASALQDASLPMLKSYDDSALFARPARRINHQGDCALYTLGVDGPRQSSEKSSSEGGKY